MSEFIPRFSEGRRADGMADEHRSGSSRYRSIADFERHLHHNGTRIMKFFLHLSKEEQRKRFLARIDEPAKNWKFNVADIDERQYWKQYMKAYEECLAATSTDRCALVYCSGRRQAKCAADRVPRHPKYTAASEDAVSRNQRGAAP